MRRQTEVHRGAGGETEARITGCTKIGFHTFATRRNYTRKPIEIDMQVHEPKGYTTEHCHTTPNGVLPKNDCCAASARFRCLKAFRYFVRSYVTNPTIISAITDMPANTPSPIGSTESFFPPTLYGMEVPSDALEVSVVDVWTAAAGLSGGVEPGSGSGGGCVCAGDAGGGAGVSVAKVVGDGVGDGAGVSVVKAGGGVGDGAGVSVVKVTGDGVLVAAAAVADVEVMIETVVVVGSGPTSAVTIGNKMHILTTSTASVPFDSIIGVSEMSHDSSMGPMLVSTVWFDTIVNGASRSPPALGMWALAVGKARDEAPRKDRMYKRSRRAWKPASIQSK